MDLNLIWFILLGILFAGYAVLEGFDLGVGALHLFTRRDSDRRVLINSIGPVWDGNEVWLVTAGGAMFAAFPDVYATLASGFYFAVILLLFSLIFRAIAIEFRGKEPWGWWKKMWDVSFSLSSIFTSLIIGIALGNLVTGVPVGADKEFSGSFPGLINPYSLLVGVTILSLFMMHGAIYLVLKTEGDINRQVRKWVKNTMTFFIICYAMTTLVTIVYIPHMTRMFRLYPVFYVVPVLTILAIANIPREIYFGREFRAFLSLCAAVFALMEFSGSASSLISSSRTSIRTTALRFITPLHQRRH